MILQAYLTERLCETIISEVNAGRGPIYMVTMEAFQDPHLEEIGWHNFLGMTVGQAVLWAANDVDPKYENPELTTSEPYVMGSHATGCGAWCSGPEDVSPPEYFWGYNRMTTIAGLFGAGDAVGGTPHAFSSGSFTEGRIAGKAAVKYVNDLGMDRPEVSTAEYEDLKKAIYQPLETYEVYRNEIARTQLCANPGCYTTCAQLPITPLLKAHAIEPDEIVIDAKSGTLDLYLGDGQGHLIWYEGHLVVEANPSQIQQIVIARNMLKAAG